MRGDPRGIPFAGRLGPFHWLSTYNSNALRADVFAGVTVAVVLVPQSMAYAQLAGVSPVHGLYASVLPLIAYALFGTSFHLAVGVVALDMLIVRSGLEGMASPGTADYLGLALLLTMMVGLLQVFMGFVRGGFLVNLLSRPVMVGFTSGAALLIALSQVGPLTGMEMEGARVLPTLVRAAIRHASEAGTAPLVLGTGALLVLLVVRWKAPRVPGPLLVVVLGAIAAAIVNAQGNGGQLDLVGSVPRGLPTLALPPAGLGVLPALFPTALALALVQFLTVVSLGKVFAARYRYSLGYDRELIAIGTANVLGGLSRALPVSGSFSRTAINVESGARTPFANVVAALTVCLCLIFLTRWLALVPVAVLGSIIVVAALTLLDVEEMRFLLRAKTVDGWIAILTFVATLVFGILMGILVGVMLSVLAILYRIGRPNIAVLGHLPGTRSFRDVKGPRDARRVEGVLILRVGASFSFMNAEFLKDELLHQTLDADPGHAVIIDASSINDLDTTAAHVLLEVAEVLRDRGVVLYFAGLNESAQSVLERTDLHDVFGEDRLFLSPHRAVRKILSRRGTSEDYLKHVPGGLD